MNATSGHVFISHGSDDRDQAAALSDFIEARGIRTWIAPRDVRPGQDYSEQLQHAIEACVAFVVLVTEKANTSPYVRAETEMAFSTHKPIFPVRQSEIQPAAGLAFFLKIRHWTDAFGKHESAAMERLGLELDVLCGVPPKEPAPTVTAPAPPPAPPPPAPPAPELRVEPPKPPPPLPAAREERLRAAIGPNADSYLGKWRRMEANRSWLSWSWPAFLASIFWFAYRRMWVPLAVGTILFLLTNYVSSRDPAYLNPAWLFLLLLIVVNGAIGNALYRRQVKTLVAKADGLDQPVALARLGAQGGVSIPGLATSLAIFLLLMIAAAAQQLNRPQPPTPGPPNGFVPPEPAPGPAPAVNTIDAAYLIGRWRGDNDSDCGSSFNSDGSWTEREGGSGSWSLAGDRLTLTANTTITLQVIPIDANTMTFVQPDGSLVRANRC
jgi:hypothetical protein